MVAFCNFGCKMQPFFHLIIFATSFPLTHLLFLPEDCKPIEHHFLFVLSQIDEVELQQRSKEHTPTG